MSSKPLIAEIMVGRDVTQSVVLASHPDERRLPNGRPSLTRRTIAMAFDGERFRAPVSLPFALHRGWSSLNGTGYCAPIRGNIAHAFLDGEWRPESFSGEEEKVLRMWGMSGSRPDEDFVYISTDRALFIRHGGAWTRHEAPESAERLFGVHGRTPNELYVCSDDKLFLWSGGQFQEVEEQPPTLVKSVLVVGDEIYAGDDYLLQWTKASAWRRCQPVVPDPTALVDIESTVIVGTFEKGVFEGTGGKFAPVTPDFMCLELQQVGRGAFAKGDDRSYVRIGSTWKRLAMPECAAGELPQLPH